MYNRVLEPFILAKIMITNGSVYGDILEPYVFPKKDYLSFSSPHYSNQIRAILQCPIFLNGWPEEHGRSRGNEKA